MFCDDVTGAVDQEEREVRAHRRQQEVVARAERARRHRLRAVELHEEVQAVVHLVAAQHARSTQRRRGARGGGGGAEHGATTAGVKEWRQRGAKRRRRRR